MKKDQSAAAGAKAVAPKFEEAMTRLEGLVRELESGDLPLEESIARFEEGQALVKVLGELLDSAELKVKAVLRQADGELRETESDVLDSIRSEGDDAAR
ncbi:MAG: exodeoxyribonuclease VII small subunit [Candidatus Eisenbacteria bacterium]|nr:exodeoxyribonuclease VII small subunit [Candidatus Eisenbacteria bacterium]MCC7141795.1 exodeoxyribonuclease VII small subunit [Candidatus Eisenbacteria bacterium]